MNDNQLLIRAMAVECERLVMETEFNGTCLPDSLQQSHVRWMCVEVEEHADDWPSSKLHRWIGFIQCALLANQVLDLDSLKSMFDNAKIAYGGTDDDLLDHLNPENPFEIDVGGPG